LLDGTPKVLSLFFEDRSGEFVGSDGDNVEVLEGAFSRDDA
jgi:hypothetical protein